MILSKINKKYESFGWRIFHKMMSKKWDFFRLHPLYHPSITLTPTPSPWIQLFFLPLPKLSPNLMRNIPHTPPPPFASLEPLVPPSLRMSWTSPLIPLNSNKPPRDSLSFLCYSKQLFSSFSLKLLFHKLFKFCLYINFIRKVLGFSKG